MVAWNGDGEGPGFRHRARRRGDPANLTDPGMVKGKMSYVAPELLEGKTADARSDLFSLGIVMHELLTGRQLFAGQNDLETLNQVKDMPIPQPSAHNPGVKPALDGVVMRALSRDPDKRYAERGRDGRRAGGAGPAQRLLAARAGEKARELAQEEGETAAAGPSRRPSHRRRSADAPDPCRRPSVARTRR